MDAEQMLSAGVGGQAAEQEEGRTSLYLVRRAEALIGALKFFAGQRDATVRRLQFFAQSDFWEWEIDNLIYSFENLAERSASWATSDAAVGKLGRLGVAVDVRVARRVRWNHGWQATGVKCRTAPADLLRETIDLWNALVDRVEEQFVTPMRRKADKYNIQTVRDLNRLRKRMPDLGTETTDGPR
ncbi:MAG TPA: hypothetical protein VF796_23935 [Humisphaera sp.]